MGIKNLGTCLIMSEYEVNVLGVKLRRLQKIGDFETPSKSAVISYNGIKKKLRKNIERKAIEEKADVAVITSQTSLYTLLRQGISYEFSLYKYK